METEPKTDASRCENTLKMWKYFHLRAFFWVVLLIIFSRRTFLFLFCFTSNWSPTGWQPCRLVRSLPMKSRKRLVRDVFDAFATDAGLVYDVTIADCFGTQ